MEDDETAPLSTWIGLIIIAAVSFWCQATVTEERFVPALNVRANYFNIPKDVAGATLMAAGASSPELFSSIVSLFITHSTLGLGTIVGSEIFNQLIICAGAVFASKNGKLVLDVAVVIREVGFYALSIGLLYYALHDHRYTIDDPEEEHIFISFKESAILFGGYIAYVAVCANMDAIVTFFSPDTIVTQEGDDETHNILSDTSTNNGYGATNDDTNGQRSHSDNQTSCLPELKNNEVEEESHESLIAYPENDSTLSLLLYIFLFPLKLTMHLTLPDVRVLDKWTGQHGSLTKASWAIFFCLIWLIVGSYAMVASLEALAALMKVPDSVVGVTVSAAGTSLPNYVASKIAAEKGFGNMAVSNAFGSNTFNIMVGLGLPWAVYTSFATGFKDYSGLRDEGITESVTLLASVLLVFIVLMALSGFVLYKWHGVLFICLYILYIVYSVARV